jgi:hypothetical protein
MTNSHLSITSSETLLTPSNENCSFKASLLTILALHENPRKRMHKAAHDFDLDFPLVNESLGTACTI